MNNFELETFISEVNLVADIKGSSAGAFDTEMLTYCFQIGMSVEEAYDEMMEWV